MKRIWNQKFNYFCLLSAALLLSLLNFSMAKAATLSIQQTGASNSTTYVVQGSNLDGVAGIELTIGYDASSLSPQPSVTSGSAASGAMMVPNATSPGRIRAAIISSTSLHGSGTLLNIVFGKRTGTGGITSFNYKIIDSKGNSLGNPDNSTVTNETTNTTGATSNSTSTGQYNYPGTFSMPGSNDPASAARPNPSVTERPQTSATPPAAPEKDADKPATSSPLPEKAGTEKPRVYKGILEFFETYKGEQTLAVLSALFKTRITDTITQEPLIAISDGKTTAQLKIALNQSSGNSPNFALSGAKMVSLKAGGEKGSWVIELLPNKNALRAILTILSDSAMIEYPLTVAPPLPASLKLDEAGFQKFLKETGTPQAPMNDLNQDGVRNYQDVYIFVANYLQSANRQQPAARSNAVTLSQTDGAKNNVQKKTKAKKSSKKTVSKKQALPLPN